MEGLYGPIYVSNIQKLAYNNVPSKIFWCMWFCAVHYWMDSGCLKSCPKKALHSLFFHHGIAIMAYTYSTMHKKMDPPLKKWGHLGSKIFCLECYCKLIFGCLRRNWAHITPPWPGLPNFRPFGPPSHRPKTIQLLNNQNFQFLYLEASVELEAETCTNRFRVKS